MAIKYKSHTDSDNKITPAELAAWFKKDGDARWVNDWRSHDAKRFR